MHTVSPFCPSVAHGGSCYCWSKSLTVPLWPLSSSVAPLMTLSGLSPSALNTPVVWLLVKCDSPAYPVSLPAPLLLKIHIPKSLETCTWFGSHLPLCLLTLSHYDVHPLWLLLAHHPSNSTPSPSLALCSSYPGFFQLHIPSCHRAFARVPFASAWKYLFLLCPTSA